MKPILESVVTTVVKQMRSASRSRSPIASTSTNQTTPEMKDELDEEIKKDIVSIPSTPSPKKRARVMKPKEPKIYVIPDVEQLPTTFK